MWAAKLETGGTKLRVMYLCQVSLQLVCVQEDYGR